MFRKVLIANRGEIAVRIIEACRELGLKTVAVFSEADRRALHVQLADEAYCIGPADPRRSYLSVAAVMSAAEVSGADAIHPGYGFMAEDPHFVEICELSKVAFIGPGHETMKVTGNKLEAKRIVAEAGVPVVPGSGAIKKEAELLSEARQLGLPVILKAAAGGGGRGMRIVEREEDLVPRFHAARREAEAAFGDPAVYLESYVRQARHVEVQIVADAHENLVHWGERECSIQRRYQKLIEESPSVGLNDAQRQTLWESALKAARALGYQNAGTAEFLFAGEQFYFIEMNARIQVEHPVSEMRVGRNLIKDQIRIAAGMPLGYAQQDVHLRGHAVECRINAEDPAREFAPSPGRVQLHSLPGGEGVRVDAALYQGLEITPHYDSLVAKLIVVAEDRATTLVKMSSALDRFRLEGLATTRGLCAEIVGHADFLAGRFHTRFLEEYLRARR